jgi:hypothetical protein
VFVEQHSSNDAADIFCSCNRVDWLIWLLGRERRLDRFARVCVKRSMRMDPYRDVERLLTRCKQERESIAVAGLTASLANHARWSAYDAVKGYAFEQMDAMNAEKSKQIKGLQRIGRNWANGLPAER